MLPIWMGQRGKTPGLARSANMQMSRFESTEITGRFLGISIPTTTTLPPSVPPGDSMHVMDFTDFIQNMEMSMQMSLSGDSQRNYLISGGGGGEGGGGRGREGEGNSNPPELISKNPLTPPPFPILTHFTGSVQICK